jgi:hypothetical protein
VYLWGHQSGAALGHALTVNSTLRFLDVSQNQLGDSLAGLGDSMGMDAGLVSLATGLASNGSVTTLQAAANSIGNAGATAIAEALRADGTALRTLNLSKNAIGDEVCM